MKPIIAYARLPFSIDTLKATTEVSKIADNEKPHFNKAHYTGEWTVIALRSPGGKVGTIVAESMGFGDFEDTELLSKSPEIKMFIQSFHCPVKTVRLLNLKKGAVIKEHRDAELSFEEGEVRLHIPLLTNEQVEFYVDGKEVKMQQGECWYINANLPHHVSNSGTTDRIHLVIDCKVNEWLKGVFDSTNKIYAKDIDDTGQKRMMIKELRIHNTQTATRLADQLEKELNLKAGC